MLIALAVDPIASNLVFYKYNFHKTYLALFEFQKELKSWEQGVKLQSFYEMTGYYLKMCVSDLSQFCLFT